MANTHNVTVFIWSGNKEFDAWLDKGKRNLKRDHGEESGHAAMKLQDIGAEKGDYVYLSFVPNQPRLHKQPPTGNHSLIRRHGAKSLASAKSDFDAEKIFLPSLYQDHDKAINYGHGAGPADMTYRFGAKPGQVNMAAMIDFVILLSQNNATWHMYDYNCAEAIAACLIKAGCPAPPDSLSGKKWSPNRLGDYCKALCDHYPDSVIKAKKPLTKETAPLGASDSQDHADNLQRAPDLMGM